MLISYNKYSICNDKILAALLATKPQKLYDHIDHNILILEEHINTAHLYHYGFNLVNTEDELDNLIELAQESKYQNLDIDHKLRNIITSQLNLFRTNIKDEAIKALQNYDVDLTNLTINYSELMAIKQIILEQRSYLNCDPDCQKIFVIVYMDDIPYGGIVIFFNNKLKDLHGSKYIWIQAITKYPIAAIISSLVNLPKLNDVLDPIIGKIGRELGADYVYVDPIFKQGLILEKYYGYRSDLNNVLPPCANIAKNVHSKVYYKYIKL